jgi:hypothetical protein
MTSTPSSTTPEVEAAIDELRRAFPAAELTAKPDGVGGAYVVVAPVPLGPPYAQADTWVGFQITYLHPQADIYPVHVRQDLSRLDGGGLGSGTSSSSFDGLPSIQLSRATRVRDPDSFSPLLKLERVLAWLLNR